MLIYCILVAAKIWISYTSTVFECLIDRALKWLLSKTAQVICSMFLNLKRVLKGHVQQENSYLPKFPLLNCPMQSSLILYLLFSHVSDIFVHMQHFIHFLRPNIMQSEPFARLHSAVLPQCHITDRCPININTFF